MTFKKTYSDVKENEVPVREGHPAIARELACSKLRQVHTDEQKLQAEIQQRVAQLGAAREAAIEIQDAFDSAISERNQERKNIAMYASTIQNGITRMAELRHWLETSFQDGHTCEQDAEFVRHQHLVEWLPALVEKSKVRLTTLDAQIAKLARENDLAVPQ